MKLLVHPAARDESRAAALWYDERRAGLGSSLLAAVDRGIARIAADPDVGPALETLPDETGVRRLLLRTFPYMIVYEAVPDAVHVIAVAHTAREPNYWLTRLSD